MIADGDLEIFRRRPAPRTLDADPALAGLAQRARTDIERLIRHGMAGRIVDIAEALLLDRAPADEAVGACVPGDDETAIGPNLGDPAESERAFPRGLEHDRAALPRCRHGRNNGSRRLRPVA